MPRTPLRHPTPSNGSNSSANASQLLVFGYACKTYRDEDKFTWQGDVARSCIPCLGDSAVLIDRFDCRPHLGSELCNFDADAVRAAGGDVDAEAELELEGAERVEQQMCEEERWRDLFEAERVEREEEEKRRQSAGAQIAYDYNGGTGAKASSSSEYSEDEPEPEPYEAVPLLKVPLGVTLPPSKQSHAIIERTAAFVAAQGPQMEIVIKARQRDTDKFSFLDWNDPLNVYYKHVLKMIKTGRYTPPPQEEKPVVQKKVRRKKIKPGDVVATVAPKPEKTGNDESDSDSDGSGGYLHPALLGGGAKASQSNSGKNSPAPGTPKIEHEPTPPPVSHIPSLNYKLGQEDDAYSAIYRQVTAFTAAKEEAELRSRRAAEAERLYQAALQQQQRQSDGANALRASQSAPALHADVSLGQQVPFIPPPPPPPPSQVDFTPFDLSTKGAPPDQYAQWFEWFYGHPPARAEQPQAVPPPPEMAATVDRVAEFVAGHGPMAEQHLMRLDNVGNRLTEIEEILDSHTKAPSHKRYSRGSSPKLDFLQAQSLYRSFYEMRLRWLLYDQHYRRIEQLRQLGHLVQAVAGDAQFGQIVQQPEDGSFYPNVSAATDVCHPTAGSSQMNPVTNDASATQPKRVVILADSNVKTPLTSETSPTRPTTRRRRFDQLPASVQVTPSLPISFALGKHPETSGGANAAPENVPAHLKSVAAGVAPLFVRDLRECEEDVPEPHLQAPNASNIGSDQSTKSNAHFSAAVEPTSVDLERQAERKKRAQEFVDKLMKAKRAKKLGLDVSEGQAEGVCPTVKNKDETESHTSNGATAAPVNEPEPDVQIVSEIDRENQRERSRSRTPKRHRRRRDASGSENSDRNRKRDRRRKRSPRSDSENEGTEKKRSSKKAKKSSKRRTRSRSRNRKDERD